MTAVGRFGHGGRRTYGVMSNLNGGLNSSVGAPGTPVGHGKLRCFMLVFFYLPIYFRKCFIIVKLWFF